MLTCVVFNASHEPLSVIKVTRGLRLWMDGKALIVEEFPDKKIQTVGKEFPAPKAVVLKTNRHTGAKNYGEATLNQRNLFARDNYTCAYCRRHLLELSGREQLTRDHVLPLCKKGEDSWSNVVTACTRCNHQKDDQAPDELRYRVQQLELELLSVLPFPDEQSIPDDRRTRYRQAIRDGDYDAAVEMLGDRFAKRKQVARLRGEIAKWSRYLIPVPQKTPTVFEIMQARAATGRKVRRAG
jgi:hypothetical protein